MSTSKEITPFTSGAINYVNRTVKSYTFKFNLQRMTKPDVNLTHWRRESYDCLSQLSVLLIFTLHLPF